MSLWESIISSWQAIYSNKLRSTLTMLGIVIGISAVVFVVSFGRGHQANISGIFQQMGANALYVMELTTGGSSSTPASGKLTLEDAQALTNRNRAPSVHIVAPMTNTRATVSYGNEKHILQISGVTPEIAQIASYPISNGTFISYQDILKRASVAVLGSDAASDLFGKENPVGKSIRITGRKFDVIGVVDDRTTMFGRPDDFVMIPLSTYQSKILTQTSARGRPVQTIGVQAVSTEEVDAAKEQITAILRQRHHIREGQDDDFRVVDLREIINRMNQVLGIFRMFIGSVGAISLVVGGIGIMNIMLVSVTERIREIGIRKAVGAKRRDILSQFLVESAMLSLSGGAIGLILAWLGCLLVTGAKLGDYSVNAPMSIDIAIIALSVSIFIGLVSGIYPAYRAARLDPIESLRHE
ncbi:MAG: FtsX-like permease family protein [Chloroflexi bacterium]|nr:FtsX-like permease family protein [Chloroflexota bacterium]